MRRAIQYPHSAGSVAFAALLQAAGLNDAEAAEALGVSSVAVYHWRTAAKVPRRPNRDAIATFSRRRARSTGLPPIEPDAWDVAAEPVVTPQ